MFLNSTSVRLGGPPNVVGGTPVEWAKVDDRNTHIFPAIVACRVEVFAYSFLFVFSIYIAKVSLEALEKASIGFSYILYTAFFASYDIHQIVAFASYIMEDCIWSPIIFIDYLICGVDQWAVSTVSAIAGIR